MMSISNGEGEGMGDGGRGDTLRLKMFAMINPWNLFFAKGDHMGGRA